MKLKDPLKPTSIWEVKRRIDVPSFVHSADAIAIEQAVGDLSGVIKILAKADSQQVIVRYDITRTDYRTIVEQLEKAGFPASDSWWSRYKANWYQYLDVNGRDSANAPPPTCCNKPPK